MAALEVVFVDNASSDESARIAEDWDGPSTVVRLSENRGFGAANNVGVRAARYDVVVLLNPDTFLLDDSFVTLARLARQRRALYGPELLHEDGSRQPSAAPLPGGWEVAVDAVVPGRVMPRRLKARCEPWRSPTTLRVGWLNGACIAAPRDVLVQLGPFDESIHLYAEDMDLGIRAQVAGVPSLFAPDVARVLHLGDRSSSRRFADAGLALTIRNRRDVVRRRRGRTRELYDFAFQGVYHVTRYVAKRVLRKDFSREQRWLKTAARQARRTTPR
jgi:GT2 family glycosyltransferase